MDVATVQLCLQFVVANASLALGLAIAIGAACGLTVNFLLSRRYVFRTDGRRISPSVLAKERRSAQELRTGDCLSPDVAGPIPQ